jgi:hypothetical protein
MSTISLPEKIKKPERRTTTRSVSLEKSIVKRLVTKAKSERRSFSWLVNEAVRLQIDKIE